jgi:hypothetical protein
MYRPITECTLASWSLPAALASRVLRKLSAPAAKSDSVSRSFRASMNAVSAVKVLIPP